MGSISTLPNTGTLNPDRRTLSIPAAYMLNHDKSGKVYVGSTGNLYARMAKHRNDLNNGIHKNRNLQSAYDEDPRFSMSFIQTESKETAVEIEQQLLDSHMSSGQLLNIASDAVNPGAAIVRSDEHKEKLRNATARQFSTEESRERHSEIIKQKWQDPEYRDKNTGRVLTSESVAKISAYVKEKWNDKEYRERMLSHRSSPEFKALAATINAKPVTVNGVTYPSNAEAARQLGVKPDALRARLKRQKLKETNEGE